MALIDEMRRQNSRSFGGATAPSLDSRVAQIPTAGLKAPAADGSQNNPLNNDLGRAITNTAAALPGAAGIPGVAGPAAGLVARAFGASQPAASALGHAVQAVAPYAPVAAGGAALAGAAGSASPPPASLPAALPAPGSSVAAAGLAGMASAGPSPSFTPSAPPTSSQVSRVGGSYSGTNVSGDVSINGVAPRGSVTSLPAGAVPSSLSDNLLVRQAQISGPGASISAQNMGAADGLAARMQAESLGRLMASGQIAAPQSGPSMILPGGSFGIRRSRGSLVDEVRSQRALQYAQGNDPASRQRNASLVQAMLEQQGANQRAADTNSLARARLGMEQETQGFANRAAAQAEQVRGQIAQEPDPSRRQSLVQRLRELSGQGPANDWRVQVTPTTKNVDGSTSEGSVIRFNQATGQAERVDVGNGRPSAPAPGTIQGGYRFKGGDPASAANWERA